MTHHVLMEYIHQAKGAGASDAEVAERLHGAGWYRVDVQDALELYARLAAVPSDGTRVVLAASKPSLVARLAPHHYDPTLVAVAAVSFVVGFIGYVVLAP